MKFKSTPEINLQNFVFIRGQIARTYFNMRHFNYVLITTTTKIQTSFNLPKICKFLSAEGHPGKVAGQAEERASHLAANGAYENENIEPSSPLFFH